MASNNGAGRDLRPALLAVVWPLFFMSVTVVALRFYTKTHHTRRPLSWDDLCMGAAVICQLVTNIFMCLGIRNGLGLHLSELSAQEQQNAVKWTLIQEPFAVSCSMLGRIGFALFLLYLLGPAQRWQRIALHVLIAAQIIINIVVVAQLLTQCGVHLSAAWDRASAATTECQDPMTETIIGYVQSSLNSTCDFCLTVIPFLIVRMLQLNLRTKIGLIAVLCLSALAFVASVVKASFIGDLSLRSDFTYSMARLSICVYIENNLVIISASIPVLRPLLTSKKKPTPTYTSSQHGSTAGMARHTGNTARGTQSRTWHSPTQRDHSSEEIMLESQPGNGRAITRTTDVSVTYIDPKLPGPYLEPFHL